MDEPEPVPTERVAISVSSPLLHERDVARDRDHDLPVGPLDLAVDPLDVAAGPLDPPVGPIVPAREPGLPPVVMAHPAWVVTAALGLGAIAASGDPRVGLVVVGVVGVAGLIRSADRRLPFSFGEGFVGYRADLGWPHGVQEDDDVKWSVRPPRTVAAPPPRPISGR